MRSAVKELTVMVGPTQIGAMKRFVLMVFCAFLLMLVPAQAYDQLEHLESMYVDRLATIESAFHKDRLTLPQRHVVALRKMESQFQREGAAQLLWTIQQAARQFLLDPTPSGLLDVDDPPQLVRVQQSYWGAYVAVARERRDKIMELQRQYRVALNRLMAEYKERDDTYAKRKTTAALQAIQPVSQLASSFDLPEIEIDLGF